MSNKFSITDNVLTPKLYLGGTFNKKGILLLDNNESWVKPIPKNIGSGNKVVLSKQTKDSLKEKIVSLLQVTSEEEYHQVCYELYKILYKVYTKDFFNKFQVRISNETKLEFNSFIGTFQNKENIKEIQFEDHLVIKLDENVNLKPFEDFVTFIQYTSRRDLDVYEVPTYENFNNDRSTRFGLSILDFISYYYFKVNVWNETSNEILNYLSCYVEVNYGDN